MSYVFEASKLPFRAISETTAAALPALLGGAELNANIASSSSSTAVSDAAPTGANTVDPFDATLSLWDRCMLVAVLRVLMERYPDTNKAIPTPDDVQVAMRIVNELDELEVAYDHIVMVRNERAQRLRGHAGAQAQRAPVADTRTAEEILMDDLLKERLGPYAGLFLASDLEDVQGDGANGEEEDDVDIAMCFDVMGQTVGIGSAAVFGCHGYHPPERATPESAETHCIAEEPCTSSR